MCVRNFLTMLNQQCATWNAQWHPAPLFSRRNVRCQSLLQNNSDNPALEKHSPGPNQRILLLIVLSTLLLLFTACQQSLFSQTAPASSQNSRLHSQVTPTDAPMATSTPMPTVEPARENGRTDSAPAPAPVGTVVYYEERVTLLTYPYEQYQSDAIDATYQWPYQRFDIERFRAEAPTPAPRDYRLIVLENAYLKVAVMPEMGGRIWQVTHKPTDAPIFYQNEVVKPTHWGAANQLGWLGLGGLEWGLPVVEHGYDWGVPWAYMPLQHSEDLAAITVFTPNDGRLLTASITISLRAGAASFEFEPTLTNRADHPLAFSFWHDAMLAPGTGKYPSASLQFILPGDRMRVHSTNDATMPPPDATFSWPIYQAENRSRLGDYAQYLGFFEAPAAQGPFAAVYDPKYDMGVVRSYPATVARGSKVFVLGWQDALASSNFTDDDSAYVELHGGLAPTFADQYELAAGKEISWRESWYPVAGLGTVSHANEFAAIRVSATRGELEVALYPTRPMSGHLVLLAGAAPGGDDSDDLLATLPFQARPDQPFVGKLPQHSADHQVTLQLRDSTGHALLSYPLGEDLADATGSAP